MCICSKIFAFISCLCTLALTAALLAVYFTVIRCSGGTTVNGMCPNMTRSGSLAVSFLDHPRTFPKGLTCPTTADSPGSCCQWRSSTCCSNAVCQTKTEYSFGLHPNSNCSQLLGLLSCSVCSPQAGSYVDVTSSDGTQRSIHICPTFCAQLLQQCAGSGSLNATDYCQSLKNVFVRDTNCYSTAATLTVRGSAAMFLIAFSFLWFVQAIII